MKIRSINLIEKEDTEEMECSICKKHNLKLIHMEIDLEEKYEGQYVRHITICKKCIVKKGMV